MSMHRSFVSRLFPRRGMDATRRAMSCSSMASDIVMVGKSQFSGENDMRKSKRSFNCGVPGRGRSTSYSVITSTIWIFEASFSMRYLP